MSFRPQGGIFIFFRYSIVKNNQLNITDFTPGVYFVWIKEKGSYIRSEKIIKF
ncbi:MAG: hypothetical protein Q8R57_14150 [Bacteroidota bacterium]|nr:hypothetical protein [Bacteroidota bacterium]